MANFRNRRIVTSNTVLSNVDQVMLVDVTANAVTVTLPDTSINEINPGHRVIIAHNLGNIVTNSITVVPNASDGATINNEASAVLDKDKQVLVLEFMENGQWNFSRNGAAEIDITGQSFTYYDGVEDVGGVVQPQGFVKESTIVTPSGNEVTVFVYLVDGRLNNYEETKAGVTKRHEPVYNATIPTQIDSITITTL